MKQHQGSILVPLVIILIIGAIGAAYVSRYFSVTAQQAVGLRQSRIVALAVDQKLEAISALLKYTAHDTLLLPSEFADAVTEQQSYDINGMPIKVSEVRINNTQPTQAMARHQFIRYPLIKQLPAAAIVSRHTIPASVNLTVELPPSLAADSVVISANDLMVWLFSAPEAVTSESKHLDDCSSLDHSARGTYIINGECELTVWQIIGSAEAPVLLVIKNADLRMQADSKVWGLVISDADNDIAVSTVAMAATAQIMGSLLVNHHIALESALNVAYAPDVIATLQSAPFMQLHQPVAGTWRDFPQ